MGDSTTKWMEPAYYEGIPHGEVNWAQLAQNWMAMQNARSRDVIPEDASSLPPPPPPIPRARPNMDLPMPPPLIPPPFFPPGLMESNGFGNPPANWGPPPPGGFPPRPGPPFPLFMPPNPPPWANVPGSSFRPPGPASAAPFSHIEGNEGDSGDYSEFYKEWDDNQRNDQKQCDSENEDSSGIPQGAMAHWLAPPNHWSQSSNWLRREGQDSSGVDMPFIDQRTRKSLPAWIREGLEKAEREKQKKMEKELKLRAAEEAAKTRRISKGLGKFDSDSSDEETEKEGDKSGSGFENDGEPIFVKSKSPPTRNRFDGIHEDHLAKSEEDLDLRSEEEKREDALLLLRRFMTEVLLTTTDVELERIVEEVIDNVKRKNAQPKILAKSSALAALSNLGAGSDEESDGESAQGQGGVDGDDERTPSPKSSGDTPVVSDDFFKAPPLPVRQPGGKSKSKLSRNDDGISTTQIPKGDERIFPDSDVGYENVEQAPSPSVDQRIPSPKEEGKEIAFSENKRSREKEDERRSVSPKRRKSSNRRSRSRDRRSRSRGRRSRSRGRRSRSRGRRSRSRGRRSRSRERRSRSRGRRSRSRDRRSRSREKRSRSRERRSRSRDRRSSNSRRKSGSSEEQSKYVSLSKSIRRSEKK